ncbi:hypothetical protein M409DRAFT_60369 [Zasmidium cellare ATCC 36951]|uniref:Uncharacterized protein n=1 Tax=Zasmidium cellare ATCC 36951 TaxID=1080233 RepID=A0A6A6BZ25_ZASCE|nr:uncharacterized protein M409DRAFT_60369 [Zasmidium cellare ATCC 36951]KAF2159965.1 hypothetical protein M409DRAFT_60369 [Zasmidium cellare ATCC 36951]
MSSHSSPAHPASDVSSPSSPAASPSAPQSPSSDALDVELVERQNELEDREWELDLREAAINDVANQISDREIDVRARERRLTQLVINWTGVQIPADQPMYEFLEQFDWTTLLVPPGFFGSGIALTDNVPQPAPAVQQMPMGPASSADRSSGHREAKATASTSTRAVKRKRSAEGETSTEANPGNSKKAKVVIDLTGDD